MFRRLLLLSLCFIYAYVFASDRVEIKTAPTWLYKVSPDLQKKPALKQISGGFYFPLIERQANLQLQTEYTHVIRHIENETGVQNASEVSVTFAPEYQQVVFHYIRLIRNGAVVSDLKLSQIKVIHEENDVDDFQYTGLKRAFVLLKDVRKNDRIDYAYSIVGFNPVFENRYSDKVWFDYQTPILNYFETIIAPADRKLYFKSFNKAPLPAEEVNGAVRIYHWNNPSLKLWESQNSAPAWYQSTPYVTVSEFKTWQDVISWGLRLFNNYKYELPAGLKKKIGDWKKKANGDQDVFVSLAIDFVQEEVRYLGLEIGSYTHKPHHPAEVYHQLFGDCKDKALLLVSILQHENIPAYAALVNTDMRSQLAEAAPSSLEFDHVIVAIDRSQYMFVDPTMSSQRGELVNMYVPAYGYALVLRDKESTLKPVEPGFLNSSSVKERLDVSYTDSSRFTVKSVFAGGAADRIRSQLASSGIGELEESYLKFYSNIYEGITQSASLQVEDDSLKNEITVGETYTIPVLAETDEQGKRKFEVFAKLLYEQLPDPGSLSKPAPLALQYPMTMQYTFQLHLPEESTLEMKQIHIRNDAYQFDFDPVVNGQQILLQYSFQTFKDHIPESALKQYKADYKKLISVLDVEFTSGGGSSGGIVYDGPVADKNINWGMVVFALLVVAALAFALKKLNSYQVDGLYEPGSGWPIGGWLAVLGVTIGIQCVLRLIEFARNNYFQLSSWPVSGTPSEMVIKTILVTDLMFSLTWLCGCIGLLYWFMNRRDIFPRLFLWYIGSMIGGQLLLLLLYGLLDNANNTVITQVASGFGRTLLYSVIWGAYVLRSERVKNTFLETA